MAQQSVKRLLRGFSMALLIGGIPLEVLATPIVTWSTTDSGTYSTTVNFESTGPLANATVVTNQFQADGLVFSGTVRANDCGYNGWVVYGMPGNTLDTYGPYCYVNATNDQFTMTFDTQVSQAAFDAYLFDDLSVDTFDLLYQGSSVASVVAMQSKYTDLGTNNTVIVAGRNFVNYPGYVRAGIVTIDGDGLVFDAVRFTEHNATQTNTYLVLDNVRYNAAAVPEPASLLLVAGGIAGLAAVRRRRSA